MFELQQAWIWWHDNVSLNETLTCLPTWGWVGGLYEATDCASLRVGQSDDTQWHDINLSATTDSAVLLILWYPMMYVYTFTFILCVPVWTTSKTKVFLILIPLTCLSVLVDRGRWLLNILASIWWCILFVGLPKHRCSRLCPESELLQCFTGWVSMFWQFFVKL